MPPPGLQIYLRPRVTLTFDLLTPKVDLTTLTICANVYSFTKYSVHKFGNRRTDERTNEQTNRSTT